MTTDFTNFFPLANFWLIHKRLSIILTTDLTILILHRIDLKFNFILKFNQIFNSYLPWCMKLNSTKWKVKHYGNRNLQFEYLVNEVDRKWAWTFVGREISFWRQLYMSMVWPHFEYAFQVLSPFRIGDIARLEKVSYWSELPLSGTVYILTA